MSMAKHISKICLCVILLQSCTVKFNLTGGNVDPRLQTLAVEQFGNEAQIVVPFLAQEVTNQLQDRFLSQSRLSLTSGDADIIISGSVTSYTISPVAITGDNQAAQNRLTIGLKVSYENTVDENDSWEQTFSNFVDFNRDRNFSSIERDLVDEILEQMTQDVFNRSIGKW